MDYQPPTVGLLGENDGLSFVSRLLAFVGLLAKMDRVHQDGHVAEHVELHDAGIYGEDGGTVLLPRCPSLPGGPVLVQRAEPLRAVYDRRLGREAREFIVPSAFAKRGHESFIRLMDLALHGCTSSFHSG